MWINKSVPTKNSLPKNLPFCSSVLSLSNCPFLLPVNASQKVTTHNQRTVPEPSLEWPKHSNALSTCDSEYWQVGVPLSNQWQSRAPFYLAAASEVRVGRQQAMLRWLSQYFGVVARDSKSITKDPSPRTVTTAPAAPIKSVS